MPRNNQKIGRNCRMMKPICTSLLYLRGEKMINKAKNRGITDLEKRHILTKNNRKKYQKLYQRKYRDDNPEKFKQYNKRFYRKHRDELLYKKRKHYNEHKEEMIAYYRKYRKDNYERIKNYFDRIKYRNEELKTLPVDELLDKVGYFEE